MGTIIKGKYSDNLRNLLIHETSQSRLTTDAPLDNNGKGEAFSPTDLLAAGLGSCMLTIIAIRAKAKQITIGQPEVYIEKIMTNSPRRIKAIKVQITFSETLRKEDRVYLEHEAKSCPVALSLSKDIDQIIDFRYY